jgi:adenosylmethionine-8-amino-7-oxononanoate aminotransferase
MDKKLKTPFPVERKIASTIQKTGMLEYGISCIPSSGCADGKNGDIIQISPPYTVSAEEIELIVGRITKVIEHVLG